MAKYRRIGRRMTGNVVLLLSVPSEMKQLRCRMNIISLVLNENAGAGHVAREQPRQANLTPRT